MPYGPAVGNATEEPSTVTSGIITGQRLAPPPLSPISAVALYRWITPSGCDGYDSHDEVTGTVHEYRET
ncbi:hypothetical protein SNOUR_20195 [Streptomyces noursei ATCC 11455]|nr:hypothetical protein SNOUR_20195 [Streptomyces noursei ATCC 11455]